MYINKEKKCVEMFDAHWYRVGDEFFPSVSAVLETLYKGKGFDAFLMSNGVQAKTIAEDAARSGSKIHSAIEQFLKGQTITPYFTYEGKEFNECEWIKMCNFVNWYNDLEIEAEEIETEVYSEKIKIAGTIDLVCKMKANKELCKLLNIDMPTDRNWVRVLLDWKSGNNIYATGDLQVGGGYFNMWNAQNPDRLADGAAIVHVGATNKTKKDYNNVGVRFSPIDTKKATKLFRHTLAIYDEMFRKNPPMLIYPMELKINEELLMTA